MSITAHALRTNGRTTPEGVDPDRVEFSWQSSGQLPANRVNGQTYELTVVNLFPDTEDAWWGEVSSTTAPFSVQYDGPALRASSRYEWRVRLHDADGPPGPWSSSSEFVTGLRAADWTASWIGGGDLDVVGRPLYLRGVANLPSPVLRARAHVSALGWYRLIVNGHDQTGDALVPRWTPLDQTVEYQTYDVTDALRVGANALTLVVGDGRFRGTLGFHSKRGVYGDKLAALVQIIVDLEDGTTHTLTSDRSWVAGHGRIAASDPKTGETIDLTGDDSAWWDTDATPAGSVPVTIVDDLTARRRTLVAEDVPRVRAIENITPVRVWRSPSGKQLVDFGQNFAGVARIDLPAALGRRVTLTFSEALTPAGELDTTWILHNVKHFWAQRDTVTLADGPTTFQPWFTIHGFRYLEVDGLPPGIDLGVDEVTGVVYSSDLPLVGTFECSDGRLNQLWSNVLWSTRSNFTDTPTDCPTRERSGWTGDIQVFAPTALRVVDAQWFLRRYLANLALEQLPDGRVPVVIPSEQSAHRRANTRLGTIVDTATDYVWRCFGTSVGWGDATVLVPWEVYQQRGDTQVLTDTYPAMRAWVDQGAHRAATGRGLHRLLSRNRVGAKEKFILDSGYHWGEWLRPGEAFPGVVVDNLLHREVVATAYLAHAARTLAQVAGVLGQVFDARRYARLADDVTDAWQAAFVRSDGTIGTDRQDDYVRALAFDLVPDEARQSAVDRLVELIEAAGDHLATGFLSTPMLLPVLTAHGRADVAYRLLLQDTAPSWLGQVARGATTIWETWEGYDEAGNASESHNHYSFGAVASWLMTDLVGIRHTDPGYRTLRIDPVIGGGITRASGSLDTPFGLVAVDWRLEDGPGERPGEDGIVHLAVTLPPGVEATIPGAGTTLRHPGKHDVTFPCASAGRGAAR